MSNFDTLVRSLASGILDDSNKNKCTIIINGNEVQAVSARIQKSIETCADGFSAEIYLPLDFTKRIVRSYAYEECEVFLGSELVITGKIYTPDITYSKDIYSAVIEGSSLATDLVDSRFYPYREFNRITLPELVQTAIDRLGLDVELEVEQYDINNEFFERATADENDTMFSFLSKLALQRGVLLTSTNEGNLKLIRTNDSGAPVCVIGDEKNPISNIKAKFDGRKRFGKYRAYATSPIRVLDNTKKRRKKSYVTKTQYRSIVVLDNEIPDTRQYSTKADDTAIANEEQAAMFAQKKAYADSINIKIPLNSWYVFGKEEIWKEVFFDR